MNLHMGHLAMVLNVYRFYLLVQNWRHMAWQCKYPSEFSQKTKKARSELAHKHPSGWELELDTHLFKVFICRARRWMPQLWLMLIAEVKQEKHVQNESL